MTFTDDDGNAETLTSEATDEVPAIWSATVTVGSGTHRDGSVYLGYSFHGGGLGAVSSRAFNLNGERYLVSAVLEGPGGLYLGLDRVLKAGFTLHIGSEGSHRATPHV